MKKRVSLLIICALLLSLTACGKENTSDSSDTEQQTASEEETEQESDSVSSDSETSLVGVYEGTEKFVEIPMGYFWEGEQKTFCNVTFPADRIATCHFADEGGSSEFNTNFSAVTLERAVEKGLLEQPYVTANILMVGNAARDNMYYVTPSTIATLESDRADAEAHGLECYEINIDGHAVLYYIDNTEYGGGDLCISYELNEDMSLRFCYGDSVKADISTEQLVRNLCSLIEVVE